MDAGLPHASVSSLVVDVEGFLFAGTGPNYRYDARGIYRSQYSTLSTPERKGSTDNVFRILRSYPTPSTNRTRISFRLASGDNVKLEVLDELGRKVWADNLLGRFEAGDHTVSLNLDRLQLGSYFARLILSNGDACQVKLLKIQ
jgi:hypothetical protein